MRSTLNKITKLLLINKQNKVIPETVCDARSPVVPNCIIVYGFLIFFLPPGRCIIRNSSVEKIV